MENNFVKATENFNTFENWVPAPYIRKSFVSDVDTTAKLTPEQSAQGILHMVLDEERLIGERPEYINYKGDFLPW